VSGNHPRWAPDGSRILVEHGGKIESLNLAANTVTVLTKTRLRELAPGWSPDQQWIVFQVGGTAVGPVASSSVWIMRPDGSDRRRISPTGLSCFAPDWGH
jgi:Tol biopolymer transport system component